jgi:hypothetical protein
MKKKDGELVGEKDGFRRRLWSEKWTTVSSPNPIYSQPLSALLIESLPKLSPRDSLLAVLTRSLAHVSNQGGHVNNT